MSIASKELNPIAIIQREGDGYAIPTSDGISAESGNMPEGSSIGGGSSDITNGGGSGCEKIPRI